MAVKLGPSCYITRSPSALSPPIHIISVNYIDELLFSLVMARATLFLFLFVAALWALSVNASPAGFTDKDLESEESLRLLYHKWVLQHGSTRNTSDERFTIFAETVKYIDSVNKKNLTYQLGLNQFSDMTDQEFAVSCVKDVGDSGDMRRVKNGSFMYQNLPDAVDWIAQGAVTPARNQGDCRCCWAFAAAAAIESLNYIGNRNRGLLSLSPQQLLDCTGGLNNCYGGTFEDAFNYVQNRGKGIVEEVYYRYQEAQGSCQDGELPQGPTIMGVQRVLPLTEDALKQAVASRPTAVNVMFGHRDIKSYRSGVYTGKCGPRINHSVVVVGYGKENKFLFPKKILDNKKLLGNMGRKWIHENSTRRLHTRRKMRYCHSGNVPIQLMHWR